MKDNTCPELICVIGHTAAGKTVLAANLAALLDGEIISADSRQVYRFMNIGTGKDYEDYIIDGKKIPYHLVDIVDPGYEYNVFEFQKDFLKAFREIRSRKKTPVLCGGTGMYIEAVLKGYTLTQVPVNEEFRTYLDSLSQEKLVSLLLSYKTPHNITDTEHRKRLIRAIEIEEYYKNHPEMTGNFPEFSYIIFGIKYEREIRRERITERLKKRLEAGMIEETRALLDMGIPEEKLVFYGLEYKYLAWYILGKLSYDEMFQNLNTAIHQFAKRQMTWFRKMERNGFLIHWIDGQLSMEQKRKACLDILRDYNFPYSITQK